MADPSVSVRSWRGTIYVIPAYSLGPGTYIHQEPVLTAKPSDPARVGSVVRDGLQRYREGGQMPDWLAYRSPVLAATGTQSWDELEQASSSCVVNASGIGFIILGEDGPTRIPSGASSVELGVAVLSALGVEK